jgi:hypothetical protein
VQIPKGFKSFVLYVQILQGLQACFLEVQIIKELAVNSLQWTVESKDPSGEEEQDAGLKPGAT